ncbi:MAG: hypothetical protein H6812_10570 [Phycisphaeraceae bacterium]|nr:hypothetical protein [Phycisphaerales bacterium]MCB9843690.1 hypothetical protein [Phycisphaeraceae bacterium]
MARTVERAANRTTAGDTGCPSVNTDRDGSPRTTTRTDRRLATIALPAPSPELDAFIDVCRNAPRAHRRAALGALVRLYAGPISRILRALGAQPQDIPDLVNEFLGIVLPARVLPVFDPARGSFNALLMLALRRHLADARRDQRRRSSLHQAYGAEVRATIISRTHRFARIDLDSGWRVLGPEATRQSIHRALRTTRAYCLSHGMLGHWRAFAMYHLMPLGPAARRPGLTEIAEALNAFAALDGASSHSPVTPHRAAVMIRSVRSRFRGHLLSFAGRQDPVKPRARRAS